MVEIVKPTIDDQIEINNLAKQVHKLHVEWNPDLFLDVDQVISKERLNGLLEKDSIFVAKLNNKIVGYIIVVITEKENGFMRYRKLITIDTLCVDKEFRNQGIGTNLMDFAREIGKKENCTDMHLTVNPNNENAIRVYENYGMKAHNISYMMKL